MKRLLILIFSLSLITEYSWAQPALFPTKPWKATLKIIDENGQPISGADISIAFANAPNVISSSDGKNWSDIEGTTETNGLFIATHTDRSTSLGIHIKKRGYYTTNLIRQMGLPEQNVNDRNISLILILKEIGQPIPMYAKYVDNGLPVFNKPVGYDLKAGDWVAPYGKGLMINIIFTGELNRKAKDDFDYKLTVNFPKEGDGIQEFNVPDAVNGSELRSPHEVPTNAYQAQVTRTMNRHPGTGTKDDVISTRNYFFRVQTVLDKNGNVKSALYGKIYGDFMQFSYYLNPTPNDRNVEFDPRHNLVKNLGSLEGVTEP